MHILVIAIFHFIKKYSKLVKSSYVNFDETWCFIKILPFSQYAQNTEQLISVDSPSWAEQNGTNTFIVAYAVVEIFCAIEALVLSCLQIRVFGFEVLDQSLVSISGGLSTLSSSFSFSSFFSSTDSCSWWVYRTNAVPWIRTDHYCY